MTATGGTTRTPRWAADLALGARLALAGGRQGWLRTVLTALGVGLGVALLLTAASLPHLLAARHGRAAARDYGSPGGRSLPRADDTMLIGQIGTAFRDLQITGFTVQPEGPRAPLPPGVAALPGPGQLVVSPALARLLGSPAGALLRPRLDHPIAGTIGQAGLSGPNEYLFYLGSDQLGTVRSGSVERIDHFGERASESGLDPVLLMLVAIAFVVLLLPVVVFIAAAARFGGEHRDRRLAALRLVGADRRMAARVAAGEALLGSLFGLAVGVLLLFVARQFIVPRFTLWNVSVFPSDVWPDPAFAVPILLGVPASAVAASLFALRHVAIEPLGVVRRAGSARRRVWWRLALPLIGIALLYPMFGTVRRTGAPPNEYQLIAGAVLLLIGVVSLLPWTIEAVVRRAGAATVSWQLAVRRLQQSGGTSTRAAGGVAVAVAGGIALQMVFTGVQVDYTHATGQDPSRAPVMVMLSDGFDAAAADQITAKFRATPGVWNVYSFVEAGIRWAGPSGPAATGDADEPSAAIRVADCATLTELAGVRQCADGDVFIAHRPPGPVGDGPLPVPGQRVTLVPGTGGSGPPWTVPRTARAITATADPDGTLSGGVLATPGAIAASELPDPVLQMYLRTDGRPDGIEYVRNTAAAVSPLMTVSSLQTASEDKAFADVRRGLLIGVVAALLLIGASLLVGVLEQLREQRRTLAVLVAFGTRRGTLSGSVLWQTAIPVLLGLVLAGIIGTGLGMALQATIRLPVRPDWAGIAQMSGVAALVVLLVTAISLPALWRLLRPDGLRTE